MSRFGGVLANLLDDPQIAKFLKEGVQVVRRPMDMRAVNKAADRGDLLADTVTYRFPVNISNHSKGKYPGRDLMRVHMNHQIDPSKTWDGADPHIEQLDVDFMSARADAAAKLGRGNASPFDEIDTSPEEKRRILLRIPAIVAAHAKLTRPEQIMWSGTSGSRNRLYSQMAKRLAAPDYADGAPAPWRS